MSENRPHPGSRYDRLDVAVVGEVPPEQQEKLADYPNSEREEEKEGVGIARGLWCRPRVM